MKKSIFVEIIVFFFVLLFIYTSAAKFAEMHLFKEEMLSSPLLGSPFLAKVMAWALPISETVLAIALFVPKVRLKALYATVGLMACFTIYVIIIYFIDHHLSCSCGGIVEQLSLRQHIFFNSACVVLGVVAISALRTSMATPRVGWFASSTAGVLLLLIGWTIFAAFSVPASIKTGYEGRLMPSFDLLLTDGTTHLNTADIPLGKPVIVIGFSPWCPHCQAETRIILKNIQQFKNVQIYYVTEYSFSEMQLFYTYYKLSDYPNITMGRDIKAAFRSYFKATTIPYIAVYDDQKRLTMVFNGEVDAMKLARLVLED
jgi:thiol-disulfide isomerase/thioredoxin